MLMNKLQAMQVFVRVVETGGITRAADSLRIPKATATTLIQQLEATLGVKLLNRTTRSVSVTTDGAAYYPRCVAILAEVRETEESLAHRHASPQGRLRVEVPTLMARLVIVPALPGFFARYPDIELQLGCSERRADLIEEGIDCAVWSGDLEDSTLIARRVGQLYFGTCAAPSYLAAHGEPRHPDELTAHRCINHFSPHTGKIFDWVFAKNGMRIQTSLRGHVALDDENSYLAAAEAFNLKPSECMMVAAHSADLGSAAASGLHTAHVARPNEYGPNTGEPGPKVPVDYSARSMMDLADKLGA